MSRESARFKVPASKVDAVRDSMNHWHGVLRTEALRGIETDADRKAAQQRAAIEQFEREHRGLPAEHDEHVVAAAAALNSTN